MTFGIMGIMANDDVITTAVTNSGPDFYQHTVELSVSCDGVTFVRTVSIVDVVNPAARITEAAGALSVDLFRHLQYLSQRRTERNNADYE